MDRAAISTFTLSASETVCVLPGAHPLARHAFLPLELLRAEPLVLLGFGAWSRARSTTLSASAACGLTSSGRPTPSAQPAPSPPRVSALAPMNRLAAALLEEARAYFDGAGDGRNPG